MDANFDERTVAGFLVERYPPGATIGQVRAGAERLASAIELIRGTGVAITYVGAVWVPDDDTIFYALVADSTETVQDAIRRAGTPVDRINHAHFVTPATPRGPPPVHPRNTAKPGDDHNDQSQGRAMNEDPMITDGVEPCHSPPNIAKGNER
jgi:hypothetical protein